jgi:hypothetical protein
MGDQPENSYCMENPSYRSSYDWDIGLEDLRWADHYDGWAIEYSVNRTDDE